MELQAKTKAAAVYMGNNWLKIFEGDATACTINSLRPGCMYRVRLRACNSAGWGQWSVPGDISTQADVPEVPLALQLATSGAVSSISVGCVGHSARCIQKLHVSTAPYRKGVLLLQSLLLWLVFFDEAALFISSHAARLPKQHSSSSIAWVLADILGHGLGASPS